MTWFEKAASSQDAGYQKKLARIYETGKIVKRDYLQAVTWYKRSAENYDVDSLYRLGWFYFDGIGVSKDVALAKNYFEKAKAYGNFQASVALEAVGIR
jgi:TPR repeat protein